MASKTTSATKTTSASKNTSVSLGEHFTHFVDRQVSEGRYGTASDVMRAGLRLLEEHEARLSVLRAALAEGERSGISTRSVADIWAEVKEEPSATRHG